MWKHSVRKDVTCVHVKSSSPTKTIGHTGGIGLLPQKNTPSRQQLVTVSPNFIEMETVKQIEKTEELILMERAREKKNETEIVYQRIQSNSDKILTELRKICIMEYSVQFSRSVLSEFFVTPWIAARQASLCITKSQSLLKLCPLSR